MTSKCVVATIDDVFTSQQALEAGRMWLTREVDYKEDPAHATGGVYVGFAGFCFYVQARDGITSGYNAGYLEFYGPSGTVLARLPWSSAGIPEETDFRQFLVDKYGSEGGAMRALLDLGAER
ncbi:hypothetical protein FDI24_gp023 [Acidovorax phage ACP17]|uniref:Uncharacterized protein n=1 Tax=Acidovorax phage ACP17 TaxID=2010329 RepID=A0A218M3E1_9CAUD|nr:hypothetical protein FDI24_gp023 [Acidovorax phage ACP17]ASD50557.1 hypothetical protein [Acidovorax phage ACP17]